MRKRIKTKIVRTGNLEKGQVIYLQDPEKVTYNNGPYIITSVDKSQIIIDRNGKGGVIGADKAVHIEIKDEHDVETNKESE